MDFLAHIDRVTEGRAEVTAQPWPDKPESIPQALALAAKAMPAFERVLRRAATSNAKIMTAIKPEESIAGKLERWKSRGRNMGTMFDVLRGTILTDSKEEVDKVVAKLSRGPVVAKFESKDAPLDALGYYGSKHLDLYLPEFKLVAEIQVMTKRLWHYKKAAHKIYKQERLKERPDPIEAARSRELYKQGNQVRPERAKPQPVDPAVRQAVRRGERLDPSD